MGVLKSGLEVVVDFDLTDGLLWGLTRALPEVEVEVREVVVTEDGKTLASPGGGGKRRRRSIFRCQGEPEDLRVAAEYLRLRPGRVFGKACGGCGEGV